MKLRTRLTLATLAATVPVALALFAFDAYTHRIAAQEVLTTFVRTRMSFERERCEADPENFGGLHFAGRPPPMRGGPPPRERPERDDDGTRRPPPPSPDEPRPSEFQTSPGDAPPSPRRGTDGKPAGSPPRPAVAFAYDSELRSRNPAAPELTDALKHALDDKDVVFVSRPLWDSDVEVLVRMTWIEGPCAVIHASGSTTERWGGVLPASPIWLLPTAAVFFAILVSMEPVIRRIRALTREAESNASKAYTGLVTEQGDDELTALARAFNRASGRILTELDEKNAREKSLRDFVANTTHDVMIPLTVLQGHLSALRESEATRDDATTRALISAMDESHYLASLLHNLGSASRLDAAADAALQRTDVELGALVSRVASRHRPIAKQLGVSLETATPEDGVTVSADPTLLEQAVSNLTYNAIRYNRSGGHVALVLERPSPNAFRLRILDDGPGIPAGELAQLGERGFRGNEARTRAPDGRGLGLDITFRALKLHGFTFELRNRTEDEGTGIEADLQGPTVCRVLPPG